MSQFRRFAVYSAVLMAIAGCRTMPIILLDSPEVCVGDEAIVVSFPSDAGLEAILTVQDGDVISLGSVSVGGVEVLGPLADGGKAPVAKVITGGSIAPVTDIAAYLKERAKDGDRHTFPKRGELEVAEIPICGPLLGWRWLGEAVVLEIGLPRGRAEWVLAPASAETFGGEYTGVSWQLRLYDVGRVYEVVVEEPVAFSEGDWRLQQRGNQSKSRAEEVFRLTHTPGAEPHAISKRNYNARQQPFFFIAGQRGATLSYADRLSRPDVGEAQEGGRIVQRSVIPVRPDEYGVIATPVKSWVFRPCNLAGQWDAIDEWTWAWDFVVGNLQERMGVRPVDPLPTLFHQQFDTPGIEYGMTAEKRTAMAPPGLEESWLYHFANDMVPKAAAWGIGLIELRAVLETDIDHSESDFPEGSFAGGSVCSPWGLAISPKLGGAAGMTYLVEKAHKHGIKVIVWSAPAHQSVCSHVVRENPEWLMLNEEGRVNNRGYVTLVGMDLAAGYGEYMTDAYRRLRAETGLDGVWADSYCAFGSDRDMSEPWPYPQIDETVRLQRAMQDMGYTVLLKEGCGPFGLSTRSGGLHDIVGREYMRYYFLYNHSDPAKRYDPDSYFRTLASKGVMEIRVPQEFEAQPAQARDRIIRANRAYNEILPLMKRRFVIGTEEKWLGVAWADESGRKRVLYCFEPFEWLVPGNAKGRELMIGEAFSVKDSVVHAIPWRVYVLD